MLVVRGSRYCVMVLVLGSRRVTRSVCIDPVHTSPFLAGTTSYGLSHLVGVGHSMIFSAFGSNIAMPPVPYSANQSRFCSSMRPRRGREPAGGGGSMVPRAVLAS